jgi:hypothetical protein
VYGRGAVWRLIRQLRYGGGTTCAVLFDNARFSEVQGQVSKRRGVERWDAARLVRLLQPQRWEEDVEGHNDGIGSCAEFDRQHLLAKEPR